MNSSIILKLDGELIRELILSAQERIYLVAPGLYSETAKAIIDNNSLFIQKKVIINIDEDKIRGGYGNIEAIEMLRANDVIVKELNESVISFIIIDNEGFILYPESRILPGTGNSDNAIRMDSQMLLRLIAKYFPEDMENEVKLFHKKLKQDKKETLRIIKEEEPSDKIKPVDKENLTSIKENIKRNPVVNPDLTRHLTTYKSKLQYVEFSFSGAHLDKKRIKIPPRAMPVKDEKFLKRLEINMELFGDFHNSSTNPLRMIENRVNNIRKSFLTPIGGGKSIILKVDKKEFEQEVIEIEEIIKKLPDLLFESLSNEIINTKKKIADELISFFKENPPEDLQEYQAKGCFEGTIKEKVNHIINKINFPQVTEIFKREMKIEYSYSDITYEDLKDEKFLSMLVNKGVISKEEKGEIVSFYKVVGIKK